MSYSTVMYTYSMLLKLSIAVCFEQNYEGNEGNRCFDPQKQREFMLIFHFPGPW